LELRVAHAPAFDNACTKDAKTAAKVCPSEPDIQK